MWLLRHGIGRCAAASNRGFAKMSSSDKFSTQDGYRWFLPVQTRWKDNDVFGHVNNAVYHAMFDTIINVYLLRHCGQAGCNSH
jgi:acyl-ACP thioesterase